MIPNVYKNPQPPANVTVGTGATNVIGFNSGRGLVTLVNLSNQDIFLAFNADAELNKGVPLVGKGASYAINGDGINYYYGPVSAICATGGATLAIQEFKP